MALCRVWSVYSNKSRLEEINEIIARSQVRAQQLLAAGSFCSPIVVTATTASSVPPVAVSRQQQTLALSAPVRHSSYQTSDDSERRRSQALTTNDDNMGHVSFDEATATEDSR